MFLMPLAAMVRSSTESIAGHGSFPAGGLMLFSVCLGLLLAIAFQAVLANLGVAIGLSFARPLLASDAETPDSPNSSAEQVDETKESSISQGQILSAVGVVAGLSLLLTVDSVLFGASFLAVRFSQLAQPLLGATLGLAVWAIYILLLFTLGSSALGSTAEVLLGGVITSLRQLMELVTQVLRSPLTQTPSPEQKQLVTAFNQQLGRLQGEIETLSLQIPQSEPASSPGRLSTDDPSASASLFSPDPVSPDRASQDQTNPDQAISLPKGSQNTASSALKAAAMSQAAVLTSAAQATVADSWQQVKDQMWQQVDEGSTALLSHLNDEAKAQVQQALGQVDLSDYSLQQLWDWARRSGGKGQGDDRPSHNLEGQSEAEFNEQPPRLLGNAAGDQTIPIESYADETVPVPPQVEQVNRDLQNYLKYTSLAKLNVDTLKQKLDELFSPWSPDSENADDSDSRLSFPLQAFDIGGWEQALQSRKGIKSVQVHQYRSVIEQKVLAIAALGNASAAEPDGLVMGLKTKLTPLLEQLNVAELSLEDFKQVLMHLAQGGNAAAYLSEKIQLSDLELTAIAPSHLLNKIKDSAALNQILPDQATSLPIQKEQEEPDALANSKAPTVPPPKDTAAMPDPGMETIATDVSQASSETLQGLTERAKQLFAQLDESLQQSIEASSDFLPTTAHPLQYLRDRLPTLQDGLFSQLTDLPEQTSEQIQSWVEETQHQFESQIQQAQAAFDEGLQTFQQQALEQAEQVRHWAAVAAWWLFGLTLSSAIAAGAAGYWAVTSPLLRLQ